jgi:hypothetical protein
MTSINDKLGLKRAGVRDMMKLPTDREERVALTAAKCPHCGNRGARASRMTPGWCFCSWCGRRWDPAKAGA